MNLFQIIKRFFQKRSEKKAFQKVQTMLQSKVSGPKKEFYLALHSKVGAMAAKKQLNLFDPVFENGKSFAPRI